MKPRSVVFAFAMSGTIALGCGGGATTTSDAAAPSDRDSYGAPVEESEESDAPPPSDAEPPTEPARTEPAATGSGDSSASRTPEQISAFVAEHRGEVRPCISKEQKNDPTLGGDVVLRLVLTPSGKVRELSVNRNETTLPSETAITCVADIVRTWQFPASSDNMDTVVNYPFTFNAKKPK